MKKVCVSIQVGCSRTKIDAETLIAYFRMNGWKVTSRFQKANLILLSTCAFDSEHEELSKKFLSITRKRMRHDAKIIIFGCLPGINEQIAKDFCTLAIVRKDFSKLDSIIEAQFPIEQINSTQYENYFRYANSSFSMFDIFMANLQKRSLFFLKYPLTLIRGRRSGDLSVMYKNRFDIRISIGCNGLCTYCAIKNAAGPLISKDPGEIITAFRYGLSQGYKSFRLSAEDVGAYGQDKGTSVIELLRNIFSQKEDFKLLIDDFSPKWLVTYFPKILDILSRNKDRIGYLGFPIQSGSEKILRMMNREYTAEDVKSCLLTLRKICPGLNLITHVLIGFPGEDDHDFYDTLNFLSVLRFRSVQLYKYSDRPNTEASQLYPKVSKSVKTRRIWRTFLLTKGRTVL